MTKVQVLVAFGILALGVNHITEGLPAHGHLTHNQQHPHGSDPFVPEEYKSGYFPRYFETMKRGKKPGCEQCCHDPRCSGIYYSYCSCF